MNMANKEILNMDQQTIETIEKGSAEAKFSKYRFRVRRTITSNLFTLSTNTIFIITIIMIALNSEKIYQVSNNHMVEATSINYGISQQPITDISQLMPKLCQNQSVICEGSFCIPNVRKCVCDLRMPVQFGRFCLRQVDIETKCFVNNQCNHTIKDALCIDVNSNAVLDAESSKFKLDQWQQLNELRQLSQSSLSNKQQHDSSKQQITTFITTTEQPSKPMFLFESNSDSNPSFEARDDVIISNARNSPYEINYNTPELLVQNHTRRKTNSSVPPFPFNLMTPATSTGGFNSLANKDTHTDDKSLFSNILLDSTSPATIAVTSISTTISSIVSNSPTATIATDSQSTPRSINMDIYRTTTQVNSIVSDSSSIGNPQQDSQKESITSTMSYSELANRKKMVVKSPIWPPGICSCPFGFMFDSMLRKCLALSLVDSHCQIDSDCKQILSTHCSQESKKCECDEPLVWNQTALACVIPKPLATTENTTPSKKDAGGFVDNLLTPLILTKLLPDYTMLLLIFVIMVIIATIIILKLTVKCFSSSNSALISPKNKKNKNKTATNNNNLPPRSPYATLRRPDHKPNSQLSNFTQATRGRILNYDFEQENPSKAEVESPQPSVSASASTQKPNYRDTRPINDRVNTMRPKSSQKFMSRPTDSTLPRSFKPTTDEIQNQSIELNDNISISQLESESKSDNSILTIPGPPPTQQPPYMLASAMKGQGSAIAAAAAAVANKRMQKKSLEQQSASKIANGSPVFL